MVTSWIGIGLTNFYIVKISTP